jgi:peptidoglycan/xylan/chitin deacetylase (PgdA/CDA1 family)
MSTPGRGSWGSARRAAVEWLRTELAYRRRGRERVIERARGVLVLMYHLVAPADDRLFRLLGSITVSPETFRKQIEWLNASFEIVSVDDAVRALADGTASERRLVAITADDGWLGFHAHALPPLRSLRMPVAIYPLIGALDGRIPCHIEWALALAQHPELAGEVMRRIRPGRANRTPPSLQAARDAIKTLPLASAQRLLSEIPSERRLPASPDTNRLFINREELRAAADSVTIGAHTVHHPILPHEDEETIRRELAESRWAIEAVTGRECVHLAYPNGDHDDRVRRIAQQLGYRTGMTTAPGWNLPGCDLFQLRRCNVNESVSVDYRGGFSEAVFAKAIGLLRLLPRIGGAQR